MDPQKFEEALVAFKWRAIAWRETVRKAAAQVTSLVAIWFILRMRSRGKRISNTTNRHGKRVREEILKKITSHIRCNKRRLQSSAVKEDSIDSADDIAQLGSPNKLNAENFVDLNRNGVDLHGRLGIHSRTPHDACSSTTGRVKLNEEDEVCSHIIKAINDIADTIREAADQLREGTEMFKNTYQRLPIDEGEVYKLLEGLGIASEHLLDAYLFLVKHPAMVRAVLGCPPEERKELVMHMVSGVRHKLTA